MSIPVEQGDPRRFQFKTAPLHEGEGQSSLECVHQAVVSSPLEDHMVITEVDVSESGSHVVFFTAKLLGHNGTQADGARNR